MDAELTRFERDREDLVARLMALVGDDSRFVALWLQGSLADGSADPLSDVDAYIAVEDAAFPAVVRERRAIVAQLGEPLVYTDSVIPGLSAAHCIMAGPVKLDLFFEAASAAANAERPAVRVLVDKVGLGATLKSGWQPPVAAAAQKLAVVYGGIRQGATWPVRLLLRGQWSTFAMCELEVINDNLAMLLASQVDPRLLFKNRFSLPRLLPAAHRDLLDDLTQTLLVALAARDLPALQQAHLASTTRSCAREAPPLPRWACLTRSARRARRRCGRSTRATGRRPSRHSRPSPASLSPLRLRPGGTDPYLHYILISTLLKQHRGAGGDAGDRQPRAA